MEGEPKINLDGEAFGAPRADGTTELVLPSGNGRRGGDFELWFWLEPRPDVVIPDWGLIVGRPIVAGIAGPVIDTTAFQDLTEALQIGFDRDEFRNSGVFPDDYVFAPIEVDRDRA